MENSPPGIHTIPGGAGDGAGAELLIVGKKGESPAWLREQQTREKIRMVWDFMEMIYRKALNL